MKLLLGNCFFNPNVRTPRIVPGRRGCNIFGNCLAEKLLVYATGRDLGFGDKKEVERIVREVREGGNGFQDLIVALVLSESFGTK